MPARKNLNKKDLIAVATNAAAGMSRRKLVAAHPGVSEKVIRTLMHAGMGEDEFKAALKGELKSVATEAIAATREAIRDGRMSPGSLPITAGIMLDKLAGLEGRAQLAGASVNIQVNNYGPGAKDELMRTLFGSPGVDMQGPASILIESGARPEAIPPAADAAVLVCPETPPADPS